jgi:hypothetical protein
VGNTLKLGGQTLLKHCSKPLILGMPPTLRIYLRATLDEGPMANEIEQFYWLRAINGEPQPLDEKVANQG